MQLRLSLLCLLTITSVFSKDEPSLALLEISGETSRQTIIAAGRAFGAAAKA
jgi:hypothetical protein